MHTQKRRSMHFASILSCGTRHPDTSTRQSELSPPFLGSEDLVIGSGTGSSLLVHAYESPNIFARTPNDECLLSVSFIQAASPRLIFAFVSKGVCEPLCTPVQYFRPEGGLPKRNKVMLRVEETRTGCCAHKFPALCPETQTSEILGWEPWPRHNLQFFIDFSMFQELDVKLVIQQSNCCVTFEQRENTLKPAPDLSWFRSHTSLSLAHPRCTAFQLVWAHGVGTRITDFGWILSLTVNIPLHFITLLNDDRRHKKTNFIRAAVKPGPSQGCIHGVFTARFEASGHFWFSTCKLAVSTNWQIAAFAVSCSVLCTQLTVQPKECAHLFWKLVRFSFVPRTRESYPYVFTGYTFVLVFLVDERVLQELCSTAEETEAGQLPVTHPVSSPVDTSSCVACGIGSQSRDRADLCTRLLHFSERQKTLFWRNSLDLRSLPTTCFKILVTVCDGNSPDISRALGLHFRMKPGSHPKSYFLLAVAIRFSSKGM